MLLFNVVNSTLLAMLLHVVHLELVLAPRSVRLLRVQ
jgi:hypothetical protein